MKGMIDSSCGFSILGVSCLLWLLFRFMEFFVKGQIYLKINSYKCFVVAPFALLQSSYFTFIPSFQIIVFLTIVTQTSSNRYEKGTPFMDISVNGKKYFKVIRYKFFVIISFALLQSSYFKFSRSFSIILFLTNFTQMPFLDRYEKVTCDSCVTQTTQPNHAHNKSCSAGTLFCTQCPKFSTKSQNDLNYHVAKKHSAPKSGITLKCKLCYAEFPGFYTSRQHRNTPHGPEMGLGASNFDVEDIVGDVDDQSLIEELQSCKHFLTDTEKENGRHRVFKFAMSSFDMSLLNDKLFSRN